MDRAVPKVIGFVQNPKPCGFSFKLTRGDGTIVDETLDLDWDVYDKTGHYIPVTATYSSSTQYWTISFTNAGDGSDPDGYFFFYRCTRGLWTQYPYRYKSAEWENPADLITQGAYEDTIPYWYVDNSHAYDGNTQYQRTGATDMPSYSAIIKSYPAGTPLFYYIHGESGSWNRQYTVYSSIPYRLRASGLFWYNVNNGAGNRPEWELGPQNPPDSNPNWSLIAAEFLFLDMGASGEGVGLTYHHLSTGTIADSFNEYEEAVTDYGLAIEGRTHYITMACSGGPGTRLLTWQRWDSTPPGGWIYGTSDQDMLGIYCGFSNTQLYAYYNF